MITQPAFWLQVRSEYIYDNFDALITYLKNYHYESGDRSFEYLSTLNCMKEMSENYASQSLSTPFYEKLNFGRPTAEIIKVMCATILAAHKAGQTLHKVIAGLIDIILKADARCTSEEAFGLVSAVLNCARGKRMLFAGISWSDISFPTNNYDLLAVKLSKMKFETDTSGRNNYWYYYENSGVVAVSPEGNLSVAAMNHKQYGDALDKVNLSDFIRLPDLMAVQAYTGSFKKCSGFDQLYEVSEGIIRQLDSVKRAVVANIKTYGPEDEFIVKVTKVHGIMVVAETIDPAYEKISGKVLLETTNGRPSVQILRNLVKEGAYLLVSLLYQNDCTFTVKHALEREYRHYASGWANAKVTAIFIKDYGSGREFVTSEGVHLGLANDKIKELTSTELEDLNLCCDEGLPVPMRMYREAPDENSANFNMYAEVDRGSLSAVSYMGSGDERFSLEEAETVMVQNFLDWWKDDTLGIGSGSDQFRAASAELFIPILTAMHRIAERGLPSCRLHLEFATAMAMLAKILGRSSELAYIFHKRAFLREEVNFAHGLAITPLPVVDSLKGVGDAERRCEIINILASYRNTHASNKAEGIAEPPAAAPRIASAVVEPIDTNKTKALIDASNSLINILDSAQLDGIKQIICRSLDIEDEYVSILDNRTFYGMESISLEFKSSVVFPPTNRRRYTSAAADPELQKWAILKAVCGFLNSRSGGELLIGVKDTGYACGISDDIKELARLGKIVTPTSDHYRTYVQNMLDRSFAVEGKEVRPQDVSRYYTDCALEENDEGIMILRVRVKPYPHGIVKFIAADSERPEGVERSYLRQSGRTIPLTAEMSDAVLAYKK